MRLFLAMCALIVQVSAVAGPIRVSFLQDDLSLKDTLDVLTNNGCTLPNATNLRQIVRHYYGEPFDFDLVRFPKPVNGFFSFSSTQELLAALPHHPGKTRHAFDFNCMDMVIMTADNHLQSKLKPDEIFGPILVSSATTNGLVSKLCASPRDAFTWGYDPQYREASEASFPKSAQDARICLTAGLYRMYILPMSTTEANLETKVLEVLQATWRSETIQFPKRFEVVLVHSADFSHLVISTDHAGLLFRSNGGYTYLEKAGGSGPFVRLDFKDKSDLLPWLAAAFLEPKPSYVKRFATFNADSIQHLSPE